MFISSRNFIILPALAIVAMAVDAKFGKYREGITRALKFLVIIVQYLPKNQLENKILLNFARIKMKFELKFQQFPNFSFAFPKFLPGNSKILNSFGK